MEVGTRLSRRTAWAVGQPISDLLARALEAPELISLAAGFVDQQTLPAGPTRKAIEATFADPDAARAALQYGTTPGYPPLRRAILDRYLRAEATDEAEARLSIDQIVITAGSNQLLYLIGGALLDPGDIVLCSAPTYLVVLGTFGNVGGRTVGVATDEAGMIPEALAERLRRIDRAGELARVKAIYLVTYSDNPRGLTLPPARRREIVRIAKEWSRSGKIHVVEDAAYRELRYAGRDVPSMRSFDEEKDTVVVAGTFSKSFSPGIRVGWGILPPHLVEPVCNQKGNIDFGSPNFNQHVMAKVLELDLYDEHVELIRASYRKKMKAMLAAADEFLAPLEGVRWIRPSGGLYVWLELPETIETGPSGKLFHAALAQDVLYVPGEYCYPQEGEPVQKNTIRLSFGVQSCEEIRTGIEALARAIQRVSGSP